MSETVKTPLTENPYQDAKGRKYFFDNAKFILITLVVIAHFISPFKKPDNMLLPLWELINTFHMPALIFISGFFAKSYIKKNGIIKVQRPATYLILYFAAQIFVVCCEIFIERANVTLSFVSARQSLWFLQCLFLWYLALPVIDKIKPQFMLPIAIACGLLIGYDTNAENILAISRVIVHFPFFLGGYYCTEENISKLFNKKFRTAAVIIIVSVFVLLIFAAPYIDSKLITCNYRYVIIKYVGKWPFVLRWAARALFYVFAVALGACVFSLVPRKKTWFTKYGAKTLQVYILHRLFYIIEYVVVGKVNSGKWDNSGIWWKQTLVTVCNGLDTWWGHLVVIAIAIIATYVLSQKIFSYPFDALQNIKITKLIKKDERV